MEIQLFSFTSERMPKEKWEYERDICFYCSPDTRVPEPILCKVRTIKMFSCVTLGAPLALPTLCLKLNTWSGNLSQFKQKNDGRSS